MKKIVDVAIKIQNPDYETLTRYKFADYLITDLKLSIRMAVSIANVSRNGFMEWIRNNKPNDKKNHKLLDDIKALIEKDNKITDNKIAFKLGVSRRTIIKYRQKFGIEKIPPTKKRANRKLKTLRINLDTPASDIRHFVINKDFKSNKYYWRYYLLPSIIVPLIKANLKLKNYKLEQLPNWKNLFDKILEHDEYVFPKKARERYEKHYITFNSVWCCDILFCTSKKDGCLLFFAIQDLYSRKIIAHCFSNPNENFNQAINTCLFNTILNNQIQIPPVLFCCDRGFEFTGYKTIKMMSNEDFKNYTFSIGGNSEFQKYCKDFGIEMSFSKPATPTHNPNIERFFREIVKNAGLSESWNQSPSIESIKERIESAVEKHNNQIEKTNEEVLILNDKNGLKLFLVCLLQNGQHYDGFPKLTKEQIYKIMNDIDVVDNKSGAKIAKYISIWLSQYDGLKSYKLSMALSKIMLENPKCQTCEEEFEKINKKIDAEFRQMTAIRTQSMTEFLSKKLFGETLQELVKKLCKE